MGASFGKDQRAVLCLLHAIEMDAGAHDSDHF